MNSRLTKATRLLTTLFHVINPRLSPFTTTFDVLLTIDNAVFTI